MSENPITDDEALARQECADDQNRWLARREREKSRIRAKVEHLVGLIDRMAHEGDQISRENSRKRVVEALLDLTFNGPGPDPLDTQDPGPGR